MSHNAYGSAWSCVACGARSKARETSAAWKQDTTVELNLEFGKRINKSTKIH